ncbi:NAD(P)-dependent oxidoreductase [Candidatus Woesearchaeota archaeon]|jgi:nucleoside-diphosphate-sugar epimerase|nr:NAD(P)-dependent oxidoreductase [Candidatus Woesearchaeota archaeon]MBT6735125.1 NAD(P)-dependent oxidoreductase [Candidatus Woesearchaeota archaeon]
MNKKKKIVICGGAGFVGHNLVPFLKNEYELVVIDKHKNNLELLKKIHPKIKIVYSDLSKKTKWEETFENADTIIQLNAQISATDYMPFKNNNITATKNIIDAMKKFNVKYIIHTSSAAVISIRLDNYAKSKKEGEEIVTKSGINYVSLRPSMMYGPFDNKNVGWLIKFMKFSPIFPIPGNGKHPRQPVYVEDYAKIIKKLIEKKPKNKIYPINGDSIDFIDMVKTILKSKKMTRLIMKIPIKTFILLLRTYNFILRKKEFTKDQVLSLTSGDEFEMFPWWDKFEIKKTSFKEGMKKITKSKYGDIMLER